VGRLGVGGYRSGWVGRKKNIFCVDFYVVG